MKQMRTEPPNDALGEFAAEHGQALLRFAFLLTSGHSAEAEDLVQSVLARLAVRGLSGIGDPVAYARRGIVNEHRSAGRHAAVERRAYPRLITDESQQDSTAIDDRLAILAALAVLSDRERAAIVLRYFEDLPDDKIAVALGCRQAAVRSLIHRAIRKLRRRLGDAYDRAETPTSTSHERGPHDDEV